MTEYKFVRATFDSPITVEVNKAAREGWTVHSVQVDQCGNTVTVLMERSENKASGVGGTQRPQFEGTVDRS